MQSAQADRGEILPIVVNMLHVQGPCHLLENLVFMTSQLTLSQTTNSPKLKEFADDNFKFDENGRKFSKRVENTVGKGEIVR